MSTLPIIKQLDALTREQILAIRPGTWGDVELLDVLKHFERDREMAVADETSPKEYRIFAADETTFSLTCEQAEQLAYALRILILKLESAGFIKRTPGQARSIQVLLAPDQLPYLE